MNEQELIEAYRNSGMSEKEALAMVGRGVVDEDAASLSEDELIELNGELAVKAIYKALSSGKVDNVMLTAAVRALQMLEDRRKREGSNDPEDDMLAWVAEVNAAKIGEA